MQICAFRYLARVTIINNPLSLLFQDATVLVKRFTVSVFLTRHGLCSEQLLARLAVKRLAAVVNVSKREARGSDGTEASQGLSKTKDLLFHSSRLFCMHRSLALISIDWPGWFIGVFSLCVNAFLCQLIVALKSIL